ncbi:MAG TPA: hypothetical protein VGR95_21665 [Thermoanaerobaculia bacterium]|jgi:hypothetical protein|nr:hypothetical protein [Thermoanaerobaculia bacterium]
MTTKRKAELQRRLSMASVPKPPAGLADRIKSDIPDLLGTTRERERLSSSISFNMRVAASIILLVSSAYLCIQLLSRADRNDAGAPPMAAMAVKAAPAKLQAAQPQEAPAVVAKTVQPEVEVAESAPVVTPASPAAPKPAPRAAEPRNEPVRDVAEKRAREAAPPPPPPTNNEPIVVTAEAPLIAAPAAPAPAPAMRMEAATAKTANAVEGGVEGRVAGGSLGGIVPSARAADFLQAPRDHVFGISVAKDAFPTVKGAIERGERPNAVNVEALINYFAGPPEHGAPREVGLEVEASPAPVTAGPRTFIIRTTIDTARQELPPGSSPLPVATDADLDIQLDGNAVVSHRRAGGGDELSGVETTLLKNVSVTAMFEVELRANLPWRQPIATVRLHYRSVATGKERTITRIVHASDVARPWSEASRRHRLATLGAVWSETLKNAPGATDVARRAEELANQEPRDAKARELAMLASASSRLQSSGPTGSGR